MIFFRWTRVGEVSDLICYPIRLGWIRLDECDFSQLGVGMGRVNDRTIMFMHEKCNPVKGNSTLVEIQLDFYAAENLDVMMMTMSLPQIEEMQVNIEAKSKTVVIDLEAWSEMKKVSDDGGDVAKWLSDFILQQNSSVKIVQFSPEIATHDARGRYKFFEKMLSFGSGATCCDKTRYNLINEATVEGSDPISFRPNIVIKGPKAGDEKSWEFIKLGAHTVFKNEPMRDSKSGKHDSSSAENQLVLRQYGNVKVGDSVYVNAN